MGNKPSVEEVRIQRIRNRPTKPPHHLPPDASLRRRSLEARSQYGQAGSFSGNGDSGLQQYNAEYPLGSCMGVPGGPNQSLAYPFRDVSQYPFTAQEPGLVQYPPEFCQYGPQQIPYQCGEEYALTPFSDLMQQYGCSYATSSTTALTSGSDGGGVGNLSRNDLDFQDDSGGRLRRRVSFAHNQNVSSGTLGILKKKPVSILNKVSSFKALRSGKGGGDDKTKNMEPVSDASPVGSFANANNEGVRESGPEKVKSGMNVRNTSPLVATETHTEEKHIDKAGSVLKSSEFEEQRARSGAQGQMTQKSSPTPVKNDLFDAKDRIYSLVVMEQSLASPLSEGRSPLVERESNKVSVVSDKGETFTVDEIASHEIGSTSIASVKLKEVKNTFVSGYCTALICAEGSGLSSKAPFMQSPSWCVIKKLMGDIIADVALEAKEESKKIQLACAIAAVRGKEIADLLKPEPKFENLSVRPSPLFGMRLVGLEYRNIPDDDKFASMLTDVTKNYGTKAGTEASSYIVLSVMLNKRLLGTRDEDRDVVANSLLLVAAGERVSNLQGVLEKSPDEPLILFDECIYGACHTVSMYVTHEGDTQAAEGLKLQKKITDSRHLPPRFGSAQALNRIIDEAVGRAQARLPELTNQAEKMNTEKFIENRMALKASLNELLEMVRTAP
ncbi:hypothetical protein DQ04_02431030 [Trypanosoma grayi]|uniref:hypothetical protein n=1 Tax=Trypanosoma grayi TaxID=71804 RepID=UPI0004F49095|nr:hypothetical protein DQ04_02431030 [Trypanosoma grayi]KEG11623.1 hypothetical protein DQ04_02431030 [Trypanosoma grayi]